MRMAILALTDRGIETALRIIDCLKTANLEHVYNVELYIQEKVLKSGSLLSLGGRLDSDRFPRIFPFSTLKELVPHLWQECQALIFVMATGIVVRQIARLLEGKDQDPAVLVLDEAGKFVIPLLSGHLGGANSLARELADSLGSVAVITTATDTRGLVAPDEYAQRFGWKVEHLKHLPAVNRLLLDRGYLKVWTEHEFEPEHPLRKDPHYLFLNEPEHNDATRNEQADVVISVFKTVQCMGDKPEQAFPYIKLIPRILSIGVGCRRGALAEDILEVIYQGLERLGAYPESVKGIFSIDLKLNENGLIEAAERLNVKFKTFPANSVQKLIEQEGLSKSEFVKGKIGVDGVCEAASLLGVKQGRLILPKYTAKGVAIAISQEKFIWSASGPETQST